MKMDICFRTNAASRNRHVVAVQGLLNERDVRWNGQYRDDTHYAVYSNDDVPNEVIDEIVALNGPGKLRLFNE